jgi:rhamnogalacturonyl hydrolase YesR
MHLSTTFIAYLCSLTFSVTALPNINRHGSHPLSLQMAESIVSRNQGILDSQTDASALLQAGFIQKAFHQILSTYPNSSLAPTLNEHIIKSADSVVPVISNATRDTTYPLDRLSNGNGLLQLWEETGEQKYQLAVEALRKSVDLQPRNTQDGLWYYVYPHWSYLDGMFSLTPFLTAYTNYFGNTSRTERTLEDMVLQLDLLWQHCYSEENGLLVHGYDDSRTAVWANNITGASPHVWGRSLGWYCMALIDTLELLPPSATHTRQYVERRFQQLMPAVVAAADAKTGAWWQVMDRPGQEGNYLESSASSMFVYTLLKGVRLGLLPTHAVSNGTVSYSADQDAYVDVAKKAYDYVADMFVVHNGNGTLGWNGTVGVCSLNSTASYEVSKLERQKFKWMLMRCGSIMWDGRLFTTVLWDRRLLYARAWKLRD